MATWRELGNAPVALSITDNGAGKVRVTYAGLECDWQHYQQCPVDSTWYAYNVTRAASAAITAKSAVSGTGYCEQDEAGFRFDTDLNYAGASWVAGDRIWIIGEATLRAYTTPSLLSAAASSDEQAIVGYNGTTSGSATFSGALNSPDTTRAYSIKGHLSRQRCKIQKHTGSPVYFGYTSLTHTTKAIIQNLTLISSWSIGNDGQALSYVDLSKANNAGMLVDRCQLVGGTQQGLLLYAKVGTITTQRCIIRCVAGQGGIYDYAGADAQTFYQSTVFGGLIGVKDALGGTYQNVVAAFAPDGASTACWDGAGGSRTYCAATDTTLASGGGNIQSLTDANLAFWGHSQRGWNDEGAGLRILTTSSLYNAGTHISGIDEDIDGNDITTNTPIGCHKGTAQPYGVSWPAANQVKTGNDFTSFAGAQTASYSPPAGGSSFNGGFN